MFYRSLLILLLCASSLMAACNKRESVWHRNVHHSTAWTKLSPAEKALRLRAYAIEHPMF